MFSEDVLSADELEKGEQKPLELDPVTVVGGRMEFEQELALRIIRHSLDATQSQRREDRDKWVCWLRKPTGTRLNHLSCARNGDIWALRPGPGNPMGQYSLVAGYGTILTTSRPVNKSKLMKIMATLQGSEEFNSEFLSMVASGEQPPRDIPDDGEVEQFARAWIEIGKLHKRGKSEDIQIAAIEKEGLSLERYNRIAELLEIYKSVQKQISQKVKALR